MTNVYVEDRGNNMVEIKLVGHAGYDPGHDIVCASISTIAGFLAKSCEQISGAEVKILPGDCSFYMPKDRVIEVVKSQFKDLAEQYPANVKINF